MSEYDNRIDLKLKNILDMDLNKVSKTSIYLTVKSKVKFPGKKDFEDYHMSCT